MRLLYVEDNPDDVDLVRRTLRDRLAGWDMQVAVNLAQARTQLATGGPWDLLLIDLGLPDGHGLDLVRELREAAVPVALVALTGQGDQGLAVAALKAGANDYLVKTAAYGERLPATLRAAVQRFAEQQSRQQRGLRVLYAEPHALDADLTRRHLERYAPHIRIEMVIDSGSLLPRLPLRAAEPWPFDALLLDYRLHPDNGLDILKLLRQDRGLDLPVVVVTGQGSEDVAAEVLRLGATDYLVKHNNYLFGLPMALENAVHRVDIERERALLRQSEASLQGLNAELEDRVLQRTAELQLARDQAQQASRAKTGFLSNMSHELRTPMHAVLGFAHLLVTDPRQPLSERQRAYAQNIARAGEHLMGLINELLDMARIEAGKLQVELQAVDLLPLLAEGQQLVAMDATEQGVVLTGIQPPDGASRGWVVRADPKRVLQVLVNLLSNAIKYNRRGGSVTLRLEDQGDQVRLVVQDTGRGLSHEQQSRLFQPFERVAAEQSGIQGSGIGLALSRRIAEMLGGELGLDSVLDQGSQFWLRLPRIESTPDGDIP